MDARRGDIVIVLIRTTSLAIDQCGPLAPHICQGLRILRLCLLVFVHHEGCLASENPSLLCLAHFIISLYISGADIELHLVLDDPLGLVQIFTEDILSFPPRRRCFQEFTLGCVQQNVLIFEQAIGCSVLLLVELLNLEVKLVIGCVQLLRFLHGTDGFRVALHLL